ncbi:MAG: DNRLRE domain-containing protein [Clostridia bacterium]|nr:DNRLRE domain-containing protein [Clostridia bacterium]
MENKAKKRPHDMAWRGSHMESKFLRGREIPEKRTENSKIFDLGRGAFQYVQYPDAVHFRDSDGNWQEIDNQLSVQKNADGKPVLRNRTNALCVEMAQQTGDAPLVALCNAAGQALAWELRGAQAGISAQINAPEENALADEDDKRADMSRVETSLTYEGILPHVDVVCRLQGTAFKDDIVLKNEQAPHKVTFDLVTNGVDLVIQENGAIVAYPSGRPEQIAFTLPSAFMRDSVGHIGSVATELITGEEHAQIILTCDEAFLADAVFPVVIDPLVETVQHSSAMEDNFVTSNSPNTVQSYSQARLRICKNTSYGECRSFLKFTDLPYFLPCNMVTKAYLRMSLYTQQGNQAVPVYLKEVLSDWSSQTITWNNQPALGEHDVDVAIIPANAGVGSTFAFDISNLVRKWYSGSNYGVAFERKITSTPNTVEFGSSDSVYHKPVIIINYVSFAGLQSHLAYDTMDCGRAGRAHVNLYNGDLVIERPLTHCGGNRMPVSVTAYYNYDLYGCSANMGTGWRLSCDQSIYKININNELHFVWCTGDGNRIYFKNQDSTVHYYQDLSGLSLKLYDDGNIYIEDKQGTELTFENPATIGDESGRLLSITDACGNTNTFQYTGWNLTGITDGAGRVTTISYANNKVSSILAPGETTPVTFEYDENRLNLITDADGSETTISWDVFMDNLYAYHVYSFGGNDGRYLNFGYSWNTPHRLESMSTVYPAGEEIYSGNCHQYTYKDMMTVVHDATVENGKDLFYQFNDFGNVVCVRDELGYASYSKFSDALLPNHPEQVSKLQRSVVNLLPNHDFESDGYWGTVSYGGTGTYAYSADQKYLGSRSMKVNKTNTDGNMCVKMSYDKLEIGKTYTLSAYIRGAGSAYTYATVSFGSKWFDGEKVTSGSEWVRIFTTFTATATNATLYFITIGGPGTIWIDCAQLEEGAVPNRYNLLRNCDFSQNSSGVPTFWYANGVNTSADAIVTGADALHPTFLTNNRMRLYGDPQTNKGIYQDLPVSGSQGDVFVVGGWAKGFSRPIGDEPRRFAIRLAFKNSSGAFVNSDILNWNEEWTDWQYISGAVIAPCAYTAIRYNVDYEKNVNYADFDGLTLYKEEFGNTFTYDEDGNVTAVKNLASKQAKAEYDDCNNLIGYVQPGRPDSAKTVLNCGSTYPERRKRLVYSITSPTNIRTNNTYDTHGNLTRSYLIDATDGNYVIDSHQTHTSDGNHVATKTDSRGKVVAYTTDLAKDTLTSVTDPNGQSVSYTYDSRKRVTGTNATADGKAYKNAYTYENDRLKTVSHNTTGDAPDVTYTFDYDRFGNPTTVKVGTNTLSTNVYTTTGDHTLMRVEYGNGGKVHYTRDDFRRVTGIHYDAATTPRFTYDYGANGQVAYVRDNELNRTVWTEYDTSERPTRVHLLESANSSSIGTPKYVGTTSYDAYGNVASYKETVNNSASFETTYTYDVENRPTQIRYGADNRKVNYTYDPIGRISGRTLTGNASYATTYQYAAPDNTDGITTTPLVASITQPGHNFSYTYDNVGNITREVYNRKNTTYVYDSLGQLIRYNDERAGKSWFFTYDRGGNLIKEQRSIVYTEQPQALIEFTQDFTYGDSNWKDKVTAIGSKAITYDAIGNITSYAGWTYTWAQGRRLIKQVQDSKTVEYDYDASGLRIRKKYNSTTSDYTWAGGKLVHLKAGSQDMHFFYDAEGMPAMMLYNQTPYFYVRNLQGDIIALVDTSGTTVVEYKYDPWGKKEAVTGTLAASVGWYNPFRYRGYIFDEETLMYYLKDRYYYPELRRFISADRKMGIKQKNFP